MAHLKTEVRHSAVTKSELIIKNISTNAASARQCCINGLSFKNHLAFYSYFLVLLCSTDLYCLFSYSSFTQSETITVFIIIIHVHPWAYEHIAPAPLPSYNCSVHTSMSLRAYSATSPAKLQLLSTYSTKCRYWKMEEQTVLLSHSSVKGYCHQIKKWLILVFQQVYK